MQLRKTSPDPAAALPFSQVPHHSPSSKLIFISNVPLNKPDNNESHLESGNWPQRPDCG
ncbi:hypothetical protein GOODEAATRI_032801, partial [Goodea atripinnis]